MIYFSYLSGNDGHIRVLLADLIVDWWNIPSGLFKPGSDIVVLAATVLQSIGQHQFALIAELPRNC
jgi:hypothetical protein